VLDSRWTGYRFGLADVLADNTSAAGFEFGPWRDPTTRPDLADVRCSWVVDGVERAEVTPAAILGDPWLALVHLGEHLAARGEVLPAGSVVLAGAMTDAVPLPAAVRLEAEGLGAVALG
jgi:2-oxo-3-hexenedioate decarboxylase